MPDWMRFVAAGLVLVVGGYLMWTVTQINKLWELDTEEYRTRWPRARDRMLRVVGLWQWCVALLLLALPGGSWVNTIALFTMGACLMLWPRINRKINERLGA